MRDEKVAEPGSRSGGAPWWLLAGALAICVGYLGVELYLAGELAFPLDDSWIHLVFARGIAAGDGLSFGSGGDLVPGSTAPGWTALLSLAFLLPGSPLAWAKVLAVAAHLGSVDATVRLARAIGTRSRDGLLAGAVVATTGWLVWSALGIMELPLFCAVTSWAMARHVGERRDPSLPPVSLALFGVGALLRPEGLLLGILAVGDRILVGERRDDALGIRPVVRRRLGIGIALSIATVAPVALFNLAVGGSALPSTFATKAGYSPPGFPDLHYLYVVLGILFQAQPAATVLAGTGAFVLLSRLGSDRDRGMLPVLWLGGLPLAYAVLSANTSRPLVGNFGRYLFPLFPVVAALGALAFSELRERLPPHLAVGGRRLRWAPVLAVLVVAAALSSLATTAGRYGQSVLNVQDSDVRLARILAARLPPEAVLAVNDIGAFGWHLPNRIVDLAGIATPEVHAYAREAMAETGDWRPGIVAFVRDVRPDYLAVFPGWFGVLVGEPGFEPILRLEIPGNITMGGDEIVLLQTPWTRHPLRPAPGGDTVPGEDRP